MKRKDAEEHFRTGLAAGCLGAAAARCGVEEKVADERPFNLLRQLVKQAKPENVPSLAAVKAAIKSQAFVLALDEERACSPRCRNW